MTTWNSRASNATSSIDRVITTLRQSKTSLNLTEIVKETLVTRDNLNTILRFLTRHNIIIKNNDHGTITYVYNNKFSRL